MAGRWNRGTSPQLDLQSRTEQTWAPQWLSRLSVDFGLGRDLTARGIGPHIRLRADSAGPEAHFEFCVSLSLHPSPTHALSLSVPKINKRKKKNKKKKNHSKQSHLFLVVIKF